MISILLFVTVTWFISYLVSTALATLIDVKLWGEPAKRLFSPVDGCIGFYIFGPLGTLFIIIAGVVLLAMKVVTYICNKAKPHITINIPDSINPEIRP